MSLNFPSFPKFCVSLGPFQVETNAKSKEIALQTEPKLALREKKTPMRFMECESISIVASLQAEYSERCPWAGGVVSILTGIHGLMSASPAASCWVSGETFRLVLLTHRLYPSEWRVSDTPLLATQAGCLREFSWREECWCFPAEQINPWSQSSGHSVSRPFPRVGPSLSLWCQPSGAW